MQLREKLDLRSKYKLYPLIFVGGFVSLALQIHAGRVLNVYHGGSTLTWGSVLSVFMITLGLGYYISGKRAGMATLRRLLGYGFLCTASMVIPILISGPYMGVEDIAYIDHPLFTSMAIYGIPSLLIGFLSPYSVEIIEERDGEAAGDIYSLSTLGSIFGALITTFFLIPRFGTFESIVVMTGMMLVSLIPLYISTDASYYTLYFLLLALLIVTSIGLLADTDGDVIYQTQSQYHEIVVEEEPGTDNRYLELSGSQSSALDLDNPDNYLYDYYDLLHTSTLYYEDNKEINDILVVGGGAGVTPNRFAEKYDANVDVVEIDPEVRRVAYEYFNGEREDVNWNIEDGRVFLENSDKKYDLIVMNSFKGINSVPIHLVTEEFYQIAEDSLNDDGVIATNVISSVDGKNGFLARSVSETKDSVFPYTKLHYNENPDEIQNVVIVSTYDQVNKSVLYSRVKSDFTGDFSSDDFTIDLLSELESEDSQVLKDSSVSEYELLPPEIQEFTSKQEEFTP